MALAIRFWFKVDNCFPIMSYDGLVYYILLVFRLWLRPAALIAISVSRRLNIACIMFMIRAFSPCCSSGYYVWELPFYLHGKALT